jgi:UPF0716 protein FxsA
MSLVKWGLIGLLALPVAELLAFILVAALIGWLWAIVLLVATSFVGILLLRRSGRDDLDRMRAALAQDGIRALHLETPGVAAVLGGILLIMPGFITDLLGAGLLLPRLRRWVAGRLAAARQRQRARRDVHVIDLTPGEWHQIPDRPSSSNNEGSKRGAKRGM